MNLLLDTHSFLWFIMGSSKLSRNAKNAIEDSDNTKFLSNASIWEIAIKLSLGKLQFVKSFDALIPNQLEKNGIYLLDIQFTHFSKLISLPFHHRDPFDRIIIAQAVVENIPVITADKIFSNYSITIIW